jgi:hypothetical protein
VQETLEIKSSDSFLTGNLPCTICGHIGCSCLLGGTMATSQTCCHLPGEMLNSAAKCADRAGIVSPLFKPGQPTPGINNYYYSNKRLETCILRKLDEANFVVIDKIYGSYMEMGIVKEIDDKTPWLGDALYWPTLIIHSPKSETTPVGPCCDGKAKHINGKSINELLFLAGPNRMCSENTTG